jgi:tryptophanase
MNREVKRLVRALEAQGIRVVKRHGGHIAVYAPDGLVFMAATPSDYRAHRNDLARLRRHGVDLPRP